MKPVLRAVRRRWARRGVLMVHEQTEPLELMTLNKASSLLGVTRAEARSLVIRRVLEPARSADGRQWITGRSVQRALNPNASPATLRRPVAPIVVDDRNAITEVPSSDDSETLEQPTHDCRATAHLHHPTGNRSRRKANVRTKHLPSEVLRGVQFLRSLSDADLARLLTSFDEVWVEPGQLLARQGEIGRQMFVVIDGNATVTVGDEPLGTIGPGEFIGEMAMLDHRPRCATVRADTPMHLLAVGPASIGDVIGNRAVAHEIAIQIAQRLRTLDASVAMREGVAPTRSQEQIA